MSSDLAPTLIGTQERPGGYKRHEAFRRLRPENVVPHIVKKSRPVGSVTRQLSPLEERVLEYIRPLIQEEIANAERIYEDIAANPGKYPADAANQLALVVARQLNIRGSRLVALKDRSVEPSVLERNGWSSDRIRTARKAGEILAVQGADGWLVPRWQFKGDQDLVPREGLGHIIRAWPAGLTALDMWMNAPNSDFEQRTPVAALQEGSWEAVVAVLESLTMS
jgi:hypothetical protein